MRRRGFTLVELLVVIAIIACLAGILVPALSAARDSAKRVQCLSNMHQLTTAWLAYTNDNRGRICSSLGAQAVNGKVGLYGVGLVNGFSWVGEGVPGPGAAQGQAKTGRLWPYVRDTRVYYCPDRAEDVVGPAFEGSLAREPGYMVSYSMNGQLAGSYENYGRLRTILMINEIRRPASTFVFIEPAQGNPNYYSPATYDDKGGVSLPAAPGHNHRINKVAGTTISFADGHAIFWLYADRSSYMPGPNTFQFDNPITAYGWDFDKVRNSPDSIQFAAWCDWPQLPPGVHLSN